MTPFIEMALNPELLNLAETVDKQKLAEIGVAIKEGVLLDEESREKWCEENEGWLKLATQVKETKTFPWPNAANVKYPLVQTAATQFAARAYPALVPNKKPVKTALVGMEADDMNEEGKTIGDHMSYQLMYEMKDWEEEMDRLCIVLPVSGVAFKKTYFHPVEGSKSSLVMPQDLIVNYWTKTLETASRVTHRIELTKNEIESRVRRGIFLRQDYQEPHADARREEKERASNRLEVPSREDYTTPVVFYECHTNWDLDEDGYAEPYIITVEASTGKVARITARFHSDSIEYDEENDIVEITPIQYFTKFGFIPSPDGGFYDMGFGLILGPLNETINTAVNQLLDAGTMSTLQAGFLGKGMRIRGGEYRLSPNEWKVTGATVEDLRKQVFPLPTKEPSTVLFQLLGTLVESGKELASIAEIFVGKMPGQNTPATTTMESVRQGMAVFTAIYKRIYKSLDKEFKKLFEMNRLYLGDEVDIVNGVSASIYRQTMYTVKPTADPDAASDAEKLVLAQALNDLANQGKVNPQVATRMMLEALRAPNIDALMELPEPQPDPDMELKKIEAQMKEQDGQVKMELAQQKAQNEQMKAEAEAKAKEQEFMWKERMNQQALNHAKEMAALKLVSEKRLAELELGVKKLEMAMNLEGKAVGAEIKEEEQRIAAQAKKEASSNK